MKHFKKITVMAITTGITMSLASCAKDIDYIKKGYSVQMESIEKLPATNPQDIKLVYKDDPTAKIPCDKYIKLGQIDVDATSAGFQKSLAEINNVFRDGAATYGGDAVVNINKNMVEYSGYIIKCQ